MRITALSAATPSDEVSPIITQQVKLVESNQQLKSAIKTTQNARKWIIEKREDAAKWGVDKLASKPDEMVLGMGINLSIDSAFDVVRKGTGATSRRLINPIRQLNGTVSTK